MTFFPLFFKVYADASKAWLTQKFTELRLLLDEEEALAKKFIDKNTQLTLQVYREQAESCGKRIEVMDDFSSRVWGISREPNPVQLLQVRPGSLISRHHLLLTPHLGHSGIEQSLHTGGIHRGVPGHPVDFITPTQVVRKYTLLG